jgi:hypothetical protein
LIWKPQNPDDCGICALRADEGVTYSNVGWGLLVNCRRCGQYVLQGDIEAVVFRVPDGIEAALACATRQSWETFGKPLVINVNT